MTVAGQHPDSIMRTVAMRIGKGERMKKSAFITGAASGTGYAIAERFAKEGYNVFLGSRSIEQAQKAAKEISEKFNIHAEGCETSQFTESEVGRIFEYISKCGYSIDSIVLNAANLGINQKSLDVDIDEFMSVYKVNVAWNFMMARAAAKMMIKKNGGSIVFVTSNSAIRVTRDRCAYCSSKSAILAMSKSFAVDWGKYRIRSNCVLPGMIKTERWRKNENHIQESLPNFTPLEDIAEFEDIADAVWYFASDESRNVTGAELVVDGGMLAQLTPEIKK